MKSLRDSSDLDVNGTQPTIVGAVCQRALVSEHWHAGVLNDPANVVHLQFEGQWHRLYFDCGVVFWRPSIAEPETIEEPTLASEFRLVDIGQRLGLVNLSLRRIDYHPLPGGVEATLEFDSGRAITFRNRDDVTTYDLVSEPPRDF